jgi:cytochrome c oxidase assembly protein subunit 15|tara:strand:+ start:39271 stop:40251 length:981 start_codon:yes stop_codon:yes gene_type:complete
MASYAFLVFAASLVVVYAGGFTTTIGAGMVFLDWPLSNGSLNPPGWVSDEGMLAEHSHRLTGMVTGLLTIGLVIGMYLFESRAWLRRLSYICLGLVVAQGLLGGMRVLLDSTPLANIHGVFAQLYVCSLAAVVVGTSGWWRELPVDLPAKEGASWTFERRLGVALTLLIVAQLVVGSIMRHQGAGMAIPYFPHSTSSGAWLPAAWNWGVIVHFLHRVGALLITGAFVFWSWRVWTSKTATTAMKRMTFLATFFLILQILLGANIIWSIRQPFETTMHVLNGVLFLCSVWSVVFAYFRPLLEGSERSAARVPNKDGVNDNSSVAQGA